jgi:hypothetical protein
MTLATLAHVLQRNVEAFTECEGCAGVFDPEETEMVGGVFEDRFGREREVPTLCPDCVVEARAAAEDALYDLD